jgi:gliding motility-associated-like protein
MSYTSTCGGDPDDDVWYTFTANNTQQTISLTASASMDAVVELLSGTCGSFTSIMCIDNAGTGGNESSIVTGLTPGTTYYIRVFDYWSGNGYPFSICVTGTAATGDDPCNAITLPTVTSDCNYLTMSNASFSSTSSANAPTPASCGGSSPYIGGYSSSSHDVWFKVTMPSTGRIFIASEPGLGTGAITDGVMALYKGSCGSLTQIACNDDHAYPGGNYPYLPYLADTTDAPGTVLYLRYWGYGSSTGNFGLCVSSPTNDSCKDALYICDLNGYHANTHGYKADRPSNMRGDAEFGASYTWTPGMTSSGSQTFGMAGAWGTGQPNTYTYTQTTGTVTSTIHYDVSIDNNSWIKFTASATSATFSVAVGECYSTGGIQMQIFSGVSCTNFVPVSDFRQGNSAFTLTANGLTAGNTYYLMIDGWGGDMCSYTVTANSGVQIPTLTAAPQSICFGDSTTLTVSNASAGSTYLWFPGGQTTSSITVAPPTTMTYSCQVSGVCGNKQTLSKTVTVNALPTISINGGVTSHSTCISSAYAMTASGANTYTWSPGTNLSGTTGATVSVTPTSTASVTYTVTGTNSSGCKSTSTITISGLALPTVSVTNNNPNTCYNQQASLNASSPTASSYSWSTSATTASITPTITTNTVYTVTVTDANGCHKSATASVTVLPLPTISSNSGTICNGQSTVLTGSGGTSYTWTPSSTLSNGGISSSSVTANPTSTTHYTITGTGANGCVSNPSTCTVTVNPLPNIGITATSQTLCAGNSTTLTASGANSYTWSPSANGSPISATPTATTTYSVTGTDGNNCANSSSIQITVNPIPSLTATPTTNTSVCGSNTGSITGIGVSGAAPLSYTWTNAYGQTVGTTANISNDSAGTYNVHVMDGNGCTANFGPYSITNPGAPAAPTVTTNTNSACVGSIITFSASSTSAGASFNWTGPNGFSSNTATFTLSPAQANQSGTYAVTASSSGCTGTAATTSVTIHTLPLVSAASQTNPYCSGSSIILNGSSANTYTWSGPGGFTSNQQNPTIANSTTLSAGVYTLSVTDANGCPGSDTASVIVNETPTLSGVFATNPTPCAGQTINLNATATPSLSIYSWSGPNGYSSGNVQNPVISNATTLQSGVYTVTATYNGCASSSTNTVNVVVNPTPVATASANWSSVNCSASTNTLSGSGGPSYSWSGPGSFSSSQQNPVVTTSGIYTLTVTNSFSCTAQDTTTITIVKTPTLTPAFSANGDTACVGDVVQLNVNSNPAPPATTFTWTGPGGFTSTSQNPTVPTTNTLYSGTFTVVASNGGCFSTTPDTVTVNIYNNPTAVASANSNGPNCSSSINSLTGSGGSLYNWTGPGGFTSSAQNPVVTTSGIYTLTVSDAHHCKNTDTTQINIIQTPGAPIATDAHTCTGGPLVLTANGSGGTITWYSDPGLTNQLATGTTYTPSIVQGTTVTYYVTVNNNGCLSTTQTVTASNYNVLVTASGNPLTGNAPLNVSFSATQSGSSAPQYGWNFGTGSGSSSLPNPVYTYNNGGTFDAIVTLTDPISGCIAMDTVEVIVKDEMILIVPNIFTPNGDGINDGFFVTSSGVKTLEGFILDRWGMTMFTWSGVNAIWDGKAPNGHPETDGTYFYVLKATSFKGETKVFKGTVTLSR